MKKLIVITLLVISMNVCAQDSVIVRMGFLFCPQGSISVKQAETGFKVFAPLSGVVVISKGKNTLIPQYNLTANAVGVLYARSISENAGVYAFGNKCILSKGGYASVGVTKQLGIAKGFLEVGTTWNNWSPDVTIGVILPLTFKIK